MAERTLATPAEHTVKYNGHLDFVINRSGKFQVKSNVNFD
jgi:hypothetical protein